MIRIFLLGLLVVVSMTSCASSGKNDEVLLWKKKFNGIQKKSMRLQKQNRDLRDQLSVYFDENRRLKSLVKSSLKDTSSPKSEIQSDFQLYASIVDLYNQGLSKMLNQEIERLSTVYSQSPFIPQALFLSGELHTKMGQSAQALKKFTEIEEHWSKDKLVPSALLKKASIYSAMKLNVTAKKVIDKLKEKYPESKEAATAEGLLSSKGT